MEAASKSAYEELETRIGDSLARLPDGSPSYNHCVGTRRLLGLCAPSFWNEWANLEDFNSWKDFTLAVIAMRTELVLEDHVRDEYISPEAADAIDCVRRTAVNVVEDALERLTNSRAIATGLIRTSQREVSSAIEQLSSGAIPSAYLVAQRCYNMVGFPVSVLRTLDSQFPYDLLKTILNTYCFILQLLDDYHDIEEDFHGRTNHSLFVWRLTAQQFELLQQNQLAALPSVADYASQLMEALATLISEKRPAPTKLQKLMSRSVEFLKQWTRDEVGGSEIPLWCASWIPEAYSPPAAVPRAFTQYMNNLQHKASSCAIQDFRAESLHSVSANVASSPTAI